MKKIANKIILLAVITGISVGLIAVLVNSFLINKKQKKDIEQLSTMLYNDYDITIKNSVETAHSMIESLSSYAQQGKLEGVNIEELASHMITNSRYGTDGYYWADKTDGTCMAMANNKGVGTNRLGLQDNKGNYLIKNIIDIALKGGGYTEYWFTKSGGTEPMPKRSYSKHIKSLDWVIGTGNYIDDIQKVLNGMIEENKAFTKRIIFFSILSLLLIIVLSVFVSFFIGNKISNPITELSDAAKTISNGDLRIRIQTQTNDEVGILANSMKRMAEELRKIIQNIKNSSSQMNAASGEVSNSSQYLAKNSNQMASTIEEVSSSIEEMASNIQQNAENSSATEKIAKQTFSNMKKMEVSGKETITATRDIAEKISIINDIAFQTNILALNAAVEAARAGELGKGFAVVAAEVRKLAERSKIAADEIAELSSKTTNISQESADNIDILVPEVNKTTDLIQEISVSSKEQSQGVDQINEAIQQLNQISQQTASSSEQLAANAEEIQSQSNSLNDLIEYFEV